MAIKIKSTPAQEAAIGALVEKYPNHDAYIDFVTTDEFGNIWVRFIHWGSEPDEFFMVEADGTVV